MKKRKPFFIKGNFQLKFIVAFVATVAAGVVSALFLIYQKLGIVVEEVAFSSHLSLQTSGELFWRTILRMNLLVACVSLGVGILIMIGLHFYLDTLFRSLAKGMYALGRGDFSFRMKRKGRFLNRQLSNDFNTAALTVDKDAREAERLINFLTVKVKTLSSGEKHTSEGKQNFKHIFKDIRHIHKVLRYALVSEHNSERNN